jgi:GNAT superfamily N-acetyltransferase
LPIRIERISYNSPTAAAIRDAMDAEMGALYAGVDESFDDDMRRNIDASLVVHAEQMIATVGAFDGERLVGHAALRPFEDDLEVKRVIVLPEYRGRGVSKLLMAELEAIAREHGVSRLILQTGDRQVEAIALYERLGYVAIPRFGLYAPVPFFLCYGKVLTP